MTSAPPIGLLLRKLDGLINATFETALADKGVTRRQWQLLNTIAGAGNTLEALNDAVAPFLQPGETAAPHLAPLVERGWVGSGDGAYRLTEEGRAELDALAEEVGRIRRLTVAGVDEEDYTRTLRTLQTMIDNLERL